MLELVMEAGVNEKTPPAELAVEGGMTGDMGAPGVEEGETALEEMEMMHSSSRALR